MSNQLGGRGAPNLGTAQVNVGATPTLLAAARPTRRSIVITNHGATVVFVGDAAVSISTGLKLLGQDGAAVSLDTTGAVYAIVGSGSQLVSLMETFDS
jgi:hypothetical protein